MDDLSTRTDSPGYEGAGPAVLRLHLREIELSLDGGRLGQEARDDALALMSFLRREVLRRPHESMADLAAKLRLISENANARSGRDAPEGAT